MPTINTPQSIELVRNKFAMQAVLLQNRLPVPPTWFAANPVVFRDVPAAQFPIVVKPYDGDGARGLWLLAEPEDAARLPQLAEGRSIDAARDPPDNRERFVDCSCSISGGNNGPTRCIIERRCRAEVVQAVRSRGRDYGALIWRPGGRRVSERCGADWQICAGVRCHASERVKHT